MFICIESTTFDLKHLMLDACMRLAHTNVRAVLAYTSKKEKKTLVISHQHQTASFSAYDSYNTIIICCLFA